MVPWESRLVFHVIAAASIKLSYTRVFGRCRIRIVLIALLVSQHILRRRQ